MLRRGNGRGGEGVRAIQRVIIANVDVSEQVGRGDGRVSVRTAVLRRPAGDPAHLLPRDRCGSPPAPRADVCCAHIAKRAKRAVVLRAHLCAWVLFAMCARRVQNVHMHCLPRINASRLTLHQLCTIFHKSHKTHIAVDKQNNVEIDFLIELTLSSVSGWLHMMSLRWTEALQCWIK